MYELDEPVTETMTAEDARGSFDVVLDGASCRRVRVVVERDGKPVAAIVSMRDLEDLQRSDQRRRALRETIRRMREAFADVPDDELQREIDKALAEVRVEMRAEREVSLHETAEKS